MTDWMLRELATGLQKLLCLSLPGTPAVDLIDGTVLAWADALRYGRVWDEARDAPRIRDGFRALAALSSEWPSPHRLVEVMPSAEPQAKLEAPTSIPRKGDDSPQAVEARKRHLARLLAECRDAIDARRRA